MAKQYYVAPNGNDNWPGTEAQPFRTISKATKAIGIGDTIFVKNGTYHELVDIHTSGTAANPIKIMAYPGHTPIIDGRAGVDGINEGIPQAELKKIDPNTGAGANFAGLFDVTGSHVIVDGFEIKRSMGRGIRIFPQSGGKSENVIVRNCNVHHNRHINILATGCSNILVENSKFSWSGNFYPARRAPLSETDAGSAVVGQSVDHFTIRNCEIFENWGEGVIVDANQGGSQFLTVEDCVIYDNMRGVYLHAVQNATFQRNYVYRSVTDRNRSNPFGPFQGVKVAPAEQPWFDQIPSKNINILNNIFVGLLQGIYTAGSVDKEEVSDFLIAYNTVVNCETNVSARVANKKNMVFRNNIVIASSADALVDDAGGRTLTDWEYSNNLWSHQPSALNGPGDVIGDPKLKNANDNPAAGQGDPNNYSLTADSPAIDLAFLLDEPRHDFFNERRGSKPDIGADEFAPSIITADFNANPNQGTAPLAVTFTDTSTSTEPITSWLWDFGDGTISGQQSPTHIFPDGNFSVTLRVTGEAGSDLISKSNLIVSNLPPVDNPPRITEGLITLYRFDEGGGDTLHDVSGEGIPLDLQINQLSAVNWLDDGLAIISPTIIATPGPAQKIIDACQESNEISIELWIDPLSKNQTGPARIVSISLNEVSRNVTIGQGLPGFQSDLYDVRLRTTQSSANGLPSFSSSGGSLAAEKSHILFTRNSSGTARLYINGILSAESTVSGDFSTWNLNFPLILANETDGDYPWLGTYHLLAAYNRALSSSEVKQNFDAGIGSTNYLTSRSSASTLLFRRFYIGHTSRGTNGFGAPELTAFGVQYPDQRCVICLIDGEQELIIHQNLDAALVALESSRDSITWIDDGIDEAV